MTNTEYNKMTQEFMNDYTKELNDFYSANHELVYNLWKSMGFTFEIWENDKAFKLAFIAMVNKMMKENTEFSQA